MTRFWWSGIAVLLLVGCAQQHQTRAGDIEVTLPWSRATPPGAPVAAGYLSIRNRGDIGDRLMAIHSDAVDRVEIHVMQHDAGLLRMRRLDGGLPLPPGDTVVLAPGTAHLMFIGPGKGFVEGAAIPATLVFETAGEMDVSFEVRPITATGSSTPHSHH